MNDNISDIKYLDQDDNLNNHDGEYFCHDLSLSLSEFAKQYEDDINIDGRCANDVIDSEK